MKVSKSELVKLLSEHLGSDEASVSSQFDKLIADIQKATNKGDVFSINGFGDFVIENGYLSFNVSPTFASEINYNYEGLMPVDIDKPDILLPSDTTDDEIERPDIKTSDIVIVDDDVAGEVDPFEELDENIADESVESNEETVDADSFDELSDSSAEESEVVDGAEDPSARQDDDVVMESDDEAPFDLDDQDSVDELENLGDSSSDSPKIVSADVDPDEIEALESLSGSAKDDESTPSDDQIFDELNDESEDDPFSDLGDDDSILMDKITTELQSGDNDDDFKDEVDETSDELIHEPDVIPVDESSVTPSVLDEFFDNNDLSTGDNSKEPTNSKISLDGTPDSDSSSKSDDIFDLGESDLDEKREVDEGPDVTEALLEAEAGGPRVVSVKEAESENKLSFGKLLPVAAVILIAALIGGAAWWFLLGPGKSESAPSTQTIVAQSPPESSTATNDTQQEGVETFPSGESIPLGSAEDDPEEPIASSDDSTESSLSQGSDAETTSLAQANVGDVSPPTTQNDETSGSVVDQSAQNNTETDTTEINPVADAVIQDDSAIQSDSNELTSTDTTFGLTGSPANLQGTVYAIIVHSLPSRQAAQIECDKITQQNLRCSVREANGPQGRRTYRVGIGQFSTIVDAQSELSNLPEPFRSRNFIARIN